MNRSIISVFIILVLCLAGCSTAGLQYASMDADVKAKQFTSPADKSNVYLFRDETFGFAVSMVVTVDGKMVGKTGGQSYFNWVLPPGKHTFESHAEDVSKLTLDTKPGKTYFIWQEVKMGVWMARSLLQEVDYTRGMEGVNKCKLLESAPVP